ncbi:zinc-dependent peptidase [Sulfuriroseicoccus oceanibius]|uniref:Zinc-dependent peptidase n=1 Tax=Sulfuriroseicoccus oceanibius TaxID=2707525 RepID=A0A6B3L6B7_9BACT|nr:M90 family metallopeptidase [Sulfuriroseicoccus oceanibius]QQL46257.1 zinc-dependent peptidase [Sulfuriroseicoccus oceanibius]
MSPVLADSGHWFGALGAATIFTLAAVPLVLGARKRRRRTRWMEEGLPSEDQQLLAERVWFYHLAPDEVRRDFDRVLRVFLEEKRFEACGGLDEVTREMQLVIGAQACLLVFGRARSMGAKALAPYDKLASILIYPSTFVARREGVWDEDDQGDVLLGESWSTGSLILAWDSVERGLENRHDGHNVVMHEFAHQLDQSDVADGVPELSSSEQARRWAAAFAPAYRRLLDAVEDGRRSVLDEYGATNPAEFFAVATETFFEKPRQLQEDEPELYEQLKRYYHLDPLGWPRVREQ